MVSGVHLLRPTAKHPPRGRCIPGSVAVSICKLFVNVVVTNGHYVNNYTSADPDNDSHTQYISCHGSVFQNLSISLVGLSYFHINESPIKKRVQSGKLAWILKINIFVVNTSSTNG